MRKFSKKIKLKRNKVLEKKIFSIVFYAYVFLPIRLTSSLRHPRNSNYLIFLGKNAWKRAISRKWGSSLLFYPYFARHLMRQEQSLIIKHLQVRIKKVTKSGGFGNVLANLKKCLFLNCLELFFTLMGLENSLFVVDSAIFQLPYLIAKSAFCSQNARNEWKKFMRRGPFCWNKSWNKSWRQEL